MGREKPSFKNTGIVIQGPTNFHDEMCDKLQPIFERDVPVVWSTWTSEPEHRIESLLRYDLDLLAVDLPAFPSHGNLNLQTTSTYNGLRHLEQAGLKYALKIRSDLWFNDFPAFLEILFAQDAEKLTFLAWHNEAKYCVDYFNFGDIQSMIKWWSCWDSSYEKTPAEKRLLNNYISILRSNKFIDQTDKEVWDMIIESPMEWFNFCLTDMVDKNIENYWARQKCDLRSYNQHKCYEG